MQNGWFENSLIVKPLNDGIDWKLFNPFTYHLREGHTLTSITVPEGYKTDFGTIPRIVWSILPPWGTYGKATVIHDYLCYL